MCQDVHCTKLTELKIRNNLQDFPIGPVVENSPSIVGDLGSSPCRETKIQHAVG